MPSGSCMCHAVQYEYSGDPVKKISRPNPTPSISTPSDESTNIPQAVCHCLTCRKFSSGASVNLIVPQDHFHLVKGSAKEYNETHESGMHLTVHFCENCGCPLYKTAERPDFEGNVILLAGTLDDPRAFDEAKPHAELYVKDRAEWWPTLDHVKQLQEFE